MPFPVTNETPPHPQLMTRSVRIFLHLNLLSVLVIFTYSHTHTPPNHTGATAQPTTTELNCTLPDPVTQLPALLDSAALRQRHSLRPFYSYPATPTARRGPGANICPGVRAVDVFRGHLHAAGWVRFGRDGLEHSAIMWSAFTNGGAIHGVWEDGWVNGAAIYIPRWRASLEGGGRR